MSFLGDFFGGSEGQPGEIVDTTPDEFVGLRKPVAAGLESIISSGGGPTAPLGVAGLTSAEQNILDQLGARGDPLASARGLTERTIGGQFLSPESNPFLKGAIGAATRPVFEGLSQNTLPGLAGAFSAAGHQVRPGAPIGGNIGSSPFLREARQATRDAGNIAGDISSNIAFGNFRAERGLQAGAVDQAQNLSTADLNQQIETLRAVALPRLIEQFGIDQGLAEFKRRQDQLFKALGLGGQLSSGQIATLQPTGGTQGADIGSILQGGAAVGGLFGGSAKREEF